jgi:hypothetical protein
MILMSKKRSAGSRIVLLGVLATSLLLFGCAGFRLHDESKAIVTAGMKEKYTQVDVPSIIDIEKTNLDNLLAEELKTVRDNHKLQVDFALLSIADNNTPMADTYTKEATERLQELGYSDGFKRVRDSLSEDIDLAVSHRQMREFSELIKNATGESPEPCRRNKLLPETMPFPASLATNIREGAENFYKQYRDACGELQSLSPTLRGQIKQAFDDWHHAESDLTTKDQAIDEVKKQLKEAQESYNQAVEALNKAKASGDKLEEELRGKAAFLLKNLESARELAKSADPGIIPEERLNAIITLLTASAGGEINTAAPDIKQAAIIAKEIPSLASDIKGLLEQAKAPSVNNLLIEMRHQVLLLEYAKQLSTLAKQRVDILKTKYEALKEEASHWLKFGDAICSYAVLSAGQPFPGQQCDSFVILSKDGKTCQLGDSSAGQLSDCALSKPWNASIKATSNVAATRELYKAMAAYLQALAVQAKPTEQNFRLIDVRHRETLAARQSAIQGWDNLIAVPINQLHAYYQAGLKPAEIADLIVKALGFTAIAIGVSQ